MQLRVPAISTIALSIALTSAPSAAQTTATTAAASPAATQDQDGASSQTNSNQIEDIVVTAQRREESLSRVGLSVTAIGAEQLATQGVDDPSDLVRLVPGFQANVTYGGAPVYTIRGVGFNTRNVSSTAPVGIYLDEAAIAYPYMSLGLVHDLERVEVLKGPQGTLYGRNTTGGLINYVAAKPTETLEAGVSFDVGSYQTLNATAYASGPLSDSVRVRTAFSFQNRGEGYQRSVTRGERLGELHQKSIRGTIDIGTGGVFSATLIGNYWLRGGDTIAPQAIFYVPDNNTALGPFANPLARASIIANPTSNKQGDFASGSRQLQTALGITYPGPLIDSEFYSGTARIGLEFSPNIRLQSLTTYQKLDQRDVADAGGVQVLTLVQDSNNDIESFSTELRLIGESERFNWSIGGYYADDGIDTFDFAYNTENATINRLRAIARSLPQTRYTAAQINASFGNFRNVARTDTKVYAGFANAELRLGDLIKVNLGGRYTRDETTFSGCTYDTNGGSLALINTVYPLFGVVGANLQPNGCYTLNTAGNGFAPIVTGDQEKDNFAWRGSVDVTPSDTSLFYASISRGYKSGGFPVISASSINQFTPIEQEELTAYEIGTKLGLFDRSVQFNLSGFYYDYKNKQVFGRVLDLIFGTLFRIRNVPEGRVYGVDGELTWRIVPELTARVAGVYLDSKVERFSDFTELGVAANIAGQPFAYTPEFQGSASLTYDGPISETLRFQADANISYQSKTQADSAGIPQFRIGEYELVNGSIGLATAEGLSVALYGRNLFDKYYWTGVSSGTETVFRFPGMPRELGVRAAFRF